MCLIVCFLSVCVFQCKCPDFGEQARQIHATVHGKSPEEEGVLQTNEKYGIYNANHRINRIRIKSYIVLVIAGLIYLPTIPVFTP